MVDEPTMETESAILDLPPVDKGKQVPEVCRDCEHNGKNDGYCWLCKKNPNWRGIKVNDDEEAKQCH